MLCMSCQCAQLARGVDQVTAVLCLNVNVYGYSDVSKRNGEEHNKHNTVNAAPQVHRPIDHHCRVIRMRSRSQNNTFLATYLYTNKQTTHLLSGN